jgi:16S rRNA (guanine(966)-N(2))-methyltransferase RsmD
MKIITGSAKGMNLQTLEGDATRPTSQRVKEAVFSMIQFEIEGATVLDVFAGCGQLGLEALSRGAKKATFCDLSRDAVDIIIANAKKTRLFDRCRVSCCDYKQMIRGLAGKESFDFIFIDPPYKDKVIPNVLRELLKADVIADGAKIICESSDADVFCADEKLSREFDVFKQSKYSISYITVLTLKNDEE